MTNGKLKRSVIYAVIILIFITLGLTGLMNISSFEQEYTDSLISTYNIKGMEVVRKVEYGLKYGKELDNFYGIDQLIQSWVTDLEGVEDVNVLLMSNYIAYGMNESESTLFNTNLSLEKIHQYEDENQILYTSGNYTYLFIPIQDRTETIAGSLVITIHNDQIQNQIKPYRKQFILYLLLFVFISIVVLTLYLSRMKIMDKENKMRKRAITWTIVVIIGLVQLAYGVMNYFMFEQAYKEIALETAHTTALSIKEDIESVIDKGVPYHQLGNIDTYFDGVLSIVESVGSIRLDTSEGFINDIEGKLENIKEIVGESETDSGTQVDEINSVINGTNEKRILDIPKQKDLDEYTIIETLVTNENNRNTHLVIKISEEYISTGLREIIIDTFTLFVTSFFFMIEILICLWLFVDRKAKNMEGVIKVEDEVENTDNLRVLTFVIYTASFMSISFIPQVMMSLYTPIEGISTDFILGLPVSVVFFGGAIFTVLGGHWNDRFGWKRVLEIGVLCLFASGLMSAFAFNGWIFIVSRSIYGVGIALVYIAMRSYAADRKSELGKKKGFLNITSGLYAGINIGAVLGSMLMEKTNIQIVFIASSVMVLFGFIILRIFFAEKDDKVARKERAAGRAKASEANVVVESAATLEGQPNAKQKKKSGFKDLRIIKFYIFVVSPVAISVLFLQFFYPLYATKVGISTANIGRAFLLNGICIAYVGPLLSSRMHKVLKNKQMAGLSVLLIGSSMLVFSAFGTLWAMLLAAGIMGLGVGFGSAAQTGYYLEVCESNGMNKGKSLGYMTNIRKIVQTLGPQLFAVLIGFGYQLGIGYLGLVIVGFSVLFMISFIKVPKRDEARNEV